jgi:hypothetical protein
MLFYIFIVRIGTLLYPISFQLKEAESNILQKIVYLNIPGALWQNIVACTLIYFHILLLNYIFSKHKLARETTMFSGVFYTLFVSLVVDNNALLPVLIANTFMLLALKNILDTLKNNQATSYIFTSGFMIGIASLFYSPYFAFIVFGVISLLQLRSFKILEKLQFFIGVFIPYYFLFAYRYWNDIPFVELNFIKNIFFRWPALNVNSLLILYVSAVVLIISVIFSIVNYGNITSKKAVQTQKKIDIFYWFMLFCLLSFLIFSTENTSHLITLSIPLALLTSIAASESKNRIFYELLHIFLIAVIFIGQFKLINF